MIGYARDDGHGACVEHVTGGGYGAGGEYG